MARNTNLTINPLILRAIQIEAIRAHNKHGTKSMLNPRIPEGQKLAILTEEVGEVARELNEKMLGNRTDEEYINNVFKELIQVAASAASWAETLNMRALPRALHANSDDTVSARPKNPNADGR